MQVQNTGGSHYWWFTVLLAPPGVSRVQSLPVLICGPGGLPRRRVGAGVAVHERSVWDRYATRRLYALLVEWRPPKESPEEDLQAMVTAQLDELHPQPRVSKHSLESRRIEIRGRVA
jgi:hypothetical protein